MKKHNILIALAMVIVVLFTACNGGNPQEPGKVRVILDSWQNTRSIESNVPLDTASYGITAVYQGTGNVESVVQTADANAKDATLSLFPGDWKIQVDAFNADGQKIGTGMSDVVSVSSGATTPCKVRVEECSGMGTLNVRLAGIYEGFEVKATIEREIGDTNPIVFNLDKAAGTYYGSMNLEHGSYLFNLFLNGNNIWTEAVRVVSHGQTNADVSVSADNRIELDTGADVNVNRITSDSLTDGGTVENGSTYVFHAAEPSIWFVDGVRQNDVKSKDFRWRASGLTVGSSCTVGALSGHDTYDTFSSMHFTVLKPGARLVTTVIEDRTYMVGEMLYIRFEGLPDDYINIEAKIENSGYITSVSSRRPFMDLEIPVWIEEAGEYTITIKAPENPEIVIPPLKINVGLPELAPSYNIHIKPEAYIGDGISIDLSEIPIGARGTMYLDGKEFEDIHFNANVTSMKSHIRDSVAVGSHDLEIRLFNGGRELTLKGNKITLNVLAEYVVPEGLTISAVDPVYSGSSIKFTVDPAIPIDMRLDVSCNGNPVDSYSRISAGEPEFSIDVPSELAVGTYEFTFTGRANNNKVHVLPSAQVQVVERPKREIEGEIPKYIYSYSRNCEVVCNDSEFIAYNGEVNFTVNGEPVEPSYKHAGENYVRVYFANSLRENVEYTLSGSLKTDDKELTFKPMNFKASSNSLHLLINPSYEPGRMNYSITPDIHLEGGESYETFTLHVKDDAGLDENLPVEDGVEYSWAYDGKKPFVFFEAEVRDANGVLLLKEDTHRNTFIASITGPDNIILSDSVSVSPQKYTVEFNRNDLDWGSDFTGVSWYLDDQSFRTNDLEITWDRSTKGKHQISCFYHIGRYGYSVANKYITVTEEKPDPRMAFDIVEIHRLESRSLGYEFYLESDVSIDSSLLDFSILMDGEDVSDRIGVSFWENEGKDLNGLLWYPQDLPLGKTLTLNISRMDGNGNTVARSSAEYDLHESYLTYYGSFRSQVWRMLFLNVEGPIRNEEFSVYIDGVETTEFNWNGVEIALDLSRFGCGYHQLQLKSKTDPSMVSEAIGWYSLPGVKFKSEAQYLNPDESMTCTLTMFKQDPAASSGDVTYRMYYQYPGKSRKDLGYNTTGVFELPTVESGALTVHVWYEATCGAEHYANDFDMTLKNCRIVGLPSYIVKAEPQKVYPLKIEWYDNLINENDFDFVWDINDDTGVGRGASVELTLPDLKNDYLNVCVNITSKTNPEVKSKLYFFVDLVDEEPLP